MYRNILVAYDGSEPSLRAVEHAASLADMYKSEKVTIFQAVHNVPMNDPMFIVHYYQFEDKEIEATFEEATKILKEKGIAHETKMLHGEPGMLISDLVNEHHYDLVVVGATGKGIIKKAFLGSVSSYVTTHIKCPVLVIK